MRLPTRRLTFQLVSLFDLLMIVVFAQYVDARERALKGQAEAKTTAEEIVRGHAENQARMERLAEEQDRLMTELLAARKNSRDLKAELEVSQEDIQQVGKVLADLFNVPEKTLSKVFRPESAAEGTRLREELKRLAAAKGAALVRHVLSFSELQKRCDLWELHLSDDNAFTLKAGDQTVRFRAESAARFSSEMFRVYKSMPQAKALVIILFTHANATVGSRNAVFEGMPGLTERLSADNERRTRFEYAYLGYLKPE